MTVTEEGLPPKYSNTYIKALQEASELTMKPGVWHKIDEYPATITGLNAARGKTQRIKYGKNQSWASLGQWDATTRKLPTGWAVFVKYLGAERP
jgi:hypothetical protein